MTSTELAVAAPAQDSPPRGGGALREAQARDEGVLRDQVRLRDQVLLRDEAELRRHRIRLAARADGGRAVGLTAVRAHLQLVRADLAGGVRTAVRDVRTACADDLARSPAAGLDRFPERFGAALDGLSAWLDPLVQARLAEFGRRYGVSPLAHAALRVEAGSAPPVRRVWGVDELLSAAFAASAGGGLARVLAGLAGVSGPLLLAVTAGTAVLVGVLIGRMRTRAVRRTRMRDWSFAVMAAVQEDLDRQWTAALVAVEAAVVAQVADLAGRRAKATQACIAAVDRRLADLAAE